MSTLPDNPSLVDRVEARVLELGGESRSRGGQIDSAPVTHRFTPGLYIREVFMPANGIFTSETHRTVNPYVMSSGRCVVYIESEERWITMQAPAFGVTQPGTRRLFVTTEDVTWTTFHVTDLTEIDELEEYLFADRDNPLLDYSGDAPRLKAGAERLLR